jgi:hypothetical protein
MIKELDNCFLWISPVGDKFCWIHPLQKMVKMQSYFRCPLCGFKLYCRNKILQNRKKQVAPHYSLKNWL